MIRDDSLSADIELIIVLYLIRLILKLSSLFCSAPTLKSGKVFSEWNEKHTEE